MHKDEEPELPLGDTGPAPRIYSSTVQVLGTGDLLTQIARCCNPVPGDRILGYVTRSRGVTVHREDCYNVLHEAEKERLVDVEWGRTGQMYPVAVHIEAWDRVGLLRDVSTIDRRREGEHGRRPHAARTPTARPASSSRSRRRASRS